MRNKTTQILVLFHLFLTCFIDQSSGKKQNEALSHLYNEKFWKNTGAIDRSQFSASSYINGEEIHLQKGTKKRDRIRRLPGQPQVGFRQYGGYITVNKTAGRAFYYYFAEADEHLRKSLPLLLWLNGGPGCSSLGYGALQEIGPFRVNSDGKTLNKNKFAWNHAANMLFLESPAGVGFSYSNTTTDIVKGGDRRTAIDNYIFLLNWLERFPEYKNRNFYISGESYAGHFVPQLAHTILHHNKKANRTIINLKGIIIGNAVINYETDTKGMYEYYATHALISDQTLYQIQKFCNFSTKPLNQSDECNEALDEADADTDGLDVYNIYASLCPDSEFTSNSKKTSVKNFDPCSDDYVYMYLNRPDVQEALHANVTKLHYNWQSC
ncbi:serine carboxypeptidase-like 40, partial [Olea europaea subsp. europaea]